MSKLTLLPLPSERRCFFLPLPQCIIHPFLLNFPGKSSSMPLPKVTAGVATITTSTILPLLRITCVFLIKTTVYL